MKGLLPVLLIVSLALYSCTTFEKHFPENTMYLTLDSLRKGMHQTEARRILAQDFKRDTIVDVIDGDRTYRVEAYWITTSRYRTIEVLKDSFRYFETQIPMLVTYDDGALRYWGTLEDYLLTEDNDVARLAPYLELEFARAK